MIIDTVSIGACRAREIERIANDWGRGQVQAADVAAYVLGVKARRIDRRAVVVSMQRGQGGETGRWGAAACLPLDQWGAGFVVLRDISTWITDEDVEAVRALLGRAAA